MRNWQALVSDTLIPMSGREQAGGGDPAPGGDEPVSHQSGDPRRQDRRYSIVTLIVMPSDFSVPSRRVM